MSLILDSTSLFSLESYAHASLFTGCQFPWEALVRLKDYIRSLELGKIEIAISSGVHLIQPELISIGEGTVIEPGAYIQGPCFIGKNCVVRHGAYLRGDIVTGDSCVIGHDTEIKHSILFNEVSAAHFNYVGDSILGNGCNLGAGVKCANFRLDKRAIWIRILEEKIETGLRKLGAIVGDGAQVGCNSVINPGTILGRNSFCFPCLNIEGYIPEGGKVKPAMKTIVE